MHDKYYHDCTALPAFRVPVCAPLWYHWRGAPTMTTRRAVTYGGLFCLLAAWLASAASTTFQDDEPPVQTTGTAGVTDTEALANDVQAHAARLRDRLSSAPVPQAPHRNPFLFESRPAPRQVPRRVQPLPEVQPLPAPDPEPVLSLIGVAEDQGPNGPARTAILTDAAETVFMVTVGQTVLGRYTVQGIGAEIVELRDTRTDATRRLVLR